jgi:hypothetical protein
MLSDGSTASCEYDFIASDRGTLRFVELMFTAHGATVHPATLELANGSQMTVSVKMGPRVGEASFSVAP